jgi:hypothetical protein
MGSRAVAQPKPSDATDRSSIRVDHSTLALLTRLFRGFATERSPGHGAFVGLSSSAGVEALGVESEVWRRLQKAAAIAKRTSMFPLSRRTLPAKQRKNLQPNLQKRQRSVHVCSVLQMPVSDPDQLLFLEHLMNERNCDRSFAHRRRHTFDAFATHVAHREYSRKTGFEQVRPTGQEPVRSA